MKRIIILLIAAMLVFSLCSCGEKAEPAQPSIEDRYYEFAKECLDSGDTEKAIAALEEGIGQTGSEKLQGLLDEINAQAEEESKKAEEEAKIKEEETAKEAEENAAKEAEDKAAEEQKKKADEAAKVSYYNSLSGKYKNLDGTEFFNALFIDLYVLDGMPKISCVYFSETVSGYFAMTDNGNGTFSVTDEGVSHLTENGEKQSVSLKAEIIGPSDSCGFDFDTMVIAPSSDGSILNLSFRLNGNEVSNVNFYRENSWAPGEFTEEFCDADEYWSV